jgi:hypothetical protein
MQRCSQCLPVSSRSHCHEQCRCCHRRCCRLAATGNSVTPPEEVAAAGLPWPPAIETNIFDLSWKYNFRCCKCTADHLAACPAARPAGPLSAAMLRRCNIQLLTGELCQSSCSSGSPARHEFALTPPPPAQSPGAACSMSDLVTLNPTPGVRFLHAGATIALPCYPSDPLQRTNYHGADVAFGMASLPLLPLLLLPLQGTACCCCGSASSAASRMGSWSNPIPPGLSSIGL